MKVHLFNEQVAFDKIIRCVYYSLCFGFCLYQICSICEIYFSYKTTTFVKYDNISKISLPAITICVDKREVIRKEFLAKHNISNVSYDFLAKFTIKEQFAAILDHEQVFGRCDVARPIKFRHTSFIFTECDVISPIKTSIDYERICFTHFAQPLNETNNYNKYLIENNFVFNDFLRFMAIFEIKVNVSQLFLKVHSREDVLDNFLKECFIKVKDRVNPETGLHLVSPVYYKRIITYSLPKPYETECFDYTSRTYISPRDCIDGCRQREERKLSDNEWPGNYLNYNNTSNELMSNMLNILHLNFIKDLEIGKLCKLECELHPECYGEVYEMEISEKEIFYPEFYIPILPPIMPDLVYSHQPAMLWEEFLSYLGSYISFWFGFSAIMLTNLLVNISNKVYIKANLLVNKRFKKTMRRKQHFNTNKSINAGTIYFRNKHRY